MPRVFSRDKRRTFRERELVLLIGEGGGEGEALVIGYFN